MTRFGFLSTYPPTRCGLATFTEALAGALAAGEPHTPTIVRVLDVMDSRRGAEDIARIPSTVELVARNRVTMRAAVRALDQCDVAIVQHEYGIYGGPDGDEIIPLLRSLNTPAIVVLHTVLSAPTDHQRVVLDTVCKLAANVVVMTDNASEILMRTYSVKRSKVRVIPHGVPVSREARPTKHSGPKRVLTWGLLSPGKGIEWGIRAVARLQDAGAPVEYVIAGQTHPKVLAREGEHYRESLQRLIDDLGLADVVTFEDHYLDDSQLAEQMARADVVLLPYDSRDQATSGVLIEAVAAGIPVVATGFPHAVELLGGGAGTIARHQDPQSMAQAIRTILRAEATAQQMHNAALRDTQDASWPAVAERYRALADRMVAIAA
ncbi:glycosyltransferase [Microbacterium sp. QXD-8]|uniref:Glycosyltransferase n=1 Tax=Microbacterium psychrotolerans TaxID=3068321 RepID=A0ABU0Z5A3_9MICO|nr:glycosyltransferase [Microbacterium sp. QXD-8]MDQ7879777.1 glycosyltransferase [Microbacterium sp. QXD-8]